MSYRAQMTQYTAHPREGRRRDGHDQGSHQPGHRGAGDQPAHLRPLRRASGRRHLRRLLRRRGQHHPQRPGHPTRRGRGAATDRHPQSPLAGRLLRRRVPLEGRHRSQSGSALIVNTHWGGVEENNHFGTHEFMDLCELLGTEPYISGNVGSGTVRGDEPVGGVPDPRRRQPDGETPPPQRPRGAVAGQVLGVGQRELGLRRQHAARVLRRPGPPVRHLLPRPRRQQAVPDRLRARTSTTTPGPRR